MNEKELYTHIQQLLGTQKPLLCIAGSRQGDLRSITQAIVTSKLEHYNIICGDAWGVDQTAALTAKWEGKKIAIFGVQPQPRNGGTPGSPYIYLPGLDYTGRDEQMIRIADEYIGIWNGYSKGTLHGYEYAQRLNKPAQLIQPQNNTRMNGPKGK